jgi:hypothetical protein
MWRHQRERLPTRDSSTPFFTRTPSIFPLTEPLFLRDGSLAREVSADCFLLSPLRSDSFFCAVRRPYVVLRVADYLEISAHISFDSL